MATGPVALGSGKLYPLHATTRRLTQEIALSRPAISQDGKYVALVHPSQFLQVLRLGDDESLKILYAGSLPKIPASFLTRLVVLRWSPTSGDKNNDDAPWLLLSDGLRLVIVNVEALASNALNASTSTSPSSIVADYQLGDQFGRLAYADFFLGKDHVVVLFEVSGSASILSTYDARRDDIANVKSSSARSFSPTKDGRSLFVLQRSKGQDQMTVLGTKDGHVVVLSSFSLYTSDTQGVLPSPNGDPVVAVWDTAAHGTAIHFFSYMGHPLKQLNITSFGPSSGFEGLGPSNIEWKFDHENPQATVIAVADNNKQVLVRRQHNRNMSTDDLGILRHPHTIDGSKAIVWQQTEGGDFSLQKGAFDAVLDPGAGGEISLLDLNADQSFVVTTPLDNSKSVWLWQPEHPDPHTVIVLRDPVRQLLWHPRNPDILVIITLSKTPGIVVWYSESRPPASCGIPLADISSSKFEGAWLEPDAHGRHPFTLTSTRAIDFGLLRDQAGDISFTSLLRAESFGMDMNGGSSSISTPSKPARKVVDASGMW
jgi:hypothetical protein